MGCTPMRRDFTLSEDMRPLGPVLPGWSGAPLPEGLDLKGQWARLRPLDATRDAKALWTQFEGHDAVWDYLSEPAPQDFDRFEVVMQANAVREGKPCYVICNAVDEAPLGYACYWTVAADMGNAEIGNVNLSPALQQTPIATEAFSLMLDWAFGHGYRRMEWKCNALNMPSRRAAQRLGFSYEGVFRNHYVIKGRSRDTAWFGMTDADWVKLRPAHQAWLAPENFDATGRQRTALRDLTAPYLFATDPLQR